MNEKISVIIPVYNVENYLNRCVDSVLKQTYREMEIILVDDGSMDRCAEICDEYEKKDKRIRVIHQKNAGLSSARNAGLDIATGELISFVDSDDFIEEDMLRKLYEALATEEAEMSLCNLRYVNEDGSWIKDKPDNIVKNECIGQMDYWKEVVDAYGLGMAYVVAWNKLYRRKLWDTVRYPAGKLNEDAYVLHELLRQCRRISCISDVGYNYVQRNGSIMSQKKRNVNFDVYDAWFGRLAYFKQIGRDDLARKQLAQFSEELSCSYLLCRTKREKEKYRGIVGEYQLLYNQLFAGQTVPVKERVKAFGCGKMPALMSASALIYRFLWTKTWKIRHIGEKR